MKKAISLIACLTAIACAGVPLHTGTERLGTDVYSVRMDGLDRDQHDIELYKQALRVCGESRGFRPIRDNVDTHLGKLRGYVVIRCLDERQVLEPSKNGI